ncbi:hypothetical protein ACFOKI_10245 [Sphingomonas qilianensis]|uniref:Uncharacterized protein n=1 Tax=Sphingomonas qilianensis TaxID=1736690 RepID=A0ABU9XQ08_9SPHN
MTPPDLTDPAQRVAYGRELRAIARPLRLTGVAFLLVGVVLAIARRLWLPELPTLVPLAALALGVLNMLAAMAMRTIYHTRRMKGE